MIEDFKNNVTSEPFPKQLEDFIKNNPSMKHESLYLCESIDMNGNVIDTKIGVNLLTNYGLKDHFADGYSRDDNMKIWLGRGNSEPDPASSSLQSYISELGQGSGFTMYTTSYPRTWDDTTKLYSCRMKVSQMYWDYTAGNNNEYEIWEIGVGHSQTALRTHALIYDDGGQQTCIVKHPNTRLYITVYWTASVSMADIPQLYNDGYYVLIDPLIALPYWGYKKMYWNFLTRGKVYQTNGVRTEDDDTYGTGKLAAWSWDTDDYTSIVSGDPRDAHYGSGPTFENTSKFFENNNIYFTGFLVDLGSSWGSSSQESKHETSYVSIQFQELQDAPEEMETYWCYTNRSFSRAFTSRTSYTGNEMNNWELLRIDNLFGTGHQYYMDSPENNRKYWDYPKGQLPCTNFNITEINMYNYITKEWDIQVPYINYPDRVYDDSWEYIYLSLKVIYKGVTKTIYVFVNRFPHDENGKPIPKITGFSNSNMVLAATDEYWDVSTYEEIPNLNAVPLELQQKRYYIVVDGTVDKLNPIMSHSDWRMHQINPSHMPVELTHETTGVLPRIKDHKSYNGWNGVSSYADRYTLGSKPLVCNSKGYFFVSYLMAFVDDNDNWTTYELLLDDKYCADKYRRWMTNNGDKIVAFYTYYETNVATGSTSLVYQSYAIAANKFAVWTITDSTSIPTREEFMLVWSDGTVVNNNTCYHMYSWSKLGYLVVAKRRTESEFIWVNVYGNNGVEMNLVQNAKHARAVENTSYAFYQDMNLSENTQYVLQLFNMATGEIDKTFTIDDGTSYTINGVYGYNEHLYVNVTSSDNISSTYYFNTTIKSSEKLSWSYDMMRSSAPYSYYDNIVEQDICISFGIWHDYKAKVINGNSLSDLFNDTNIQSYVKERNIFPCVNSINDGKQLILTTTGSGNDNSSNIVFDLGLFLDGNNIYTQHYPYAHYRNPDCDYVIYDGWQTTTGPVFPFKNGIIKISSDIISSYAATSGRICWFPIEMCLPMHMKGTTRTLNSYNAPVKWYLNKRISWDFTNDLSRLLPENNGG
jgi:hypothetical protein